MQEGVIRMCSIGVSNRGKLQTKKGKIKPFLNVEKSEISQHPRNPLVSFGGDSL